MKQYKSVDDKDIRNAVRSIPTLLPRNLDEKVSRALETRRRSGRLPWVKSLGVGTALAASLLLAALALTGPWFHKESESAPVPRGAIETRIHIPGKKITILWTQREGFFLPSTRGVKP